MMVSARKLTVGQLIEVLDLLASGAGRQEDHEKELSDMRASDDFTGVRDEVRWQLLDPLMKGLREMENNQQQAGLNTALVAHILGKLERMSSRLEAMQPR